MNGITRDDALSRVPFRFDREMGERERLSGVDRVRECLRKLGLEIQVLRSPEGTATASEAAAAAGCELGAIVKSLLFLVDDAPVLVLVAGDRKADPRKLGRLFGVSKKRVRIADAETVERVTGYPVGGVPPVGHLTSLPVIVDQTLERFETVWASAGAPDAIFPIDTRLLIEITGGRVEDVVKMGLQEFLDHLLEAS